MILHYTAHLHYGVEGHTYRGSLCMRAHVNGGGTDQSCSPPTLGTHTHTQPQTAKHPSLHSPNVLDKNIFQINLHIRLMN